VRAQVELLEVPDQHVVLFVLLIVGVLLRQVPVVGEAETETMVLRAPAAQPVQVALVPQVEQIHLQIMI